MTEPNRQATLEPFGFKIRRLRQERKLSQDRLAIEAHVDQSGLSKIERGKDRGIGEAALKRIAAVLHISFEALVENTDYHVR